MKKKTLSLVLSLCVIFAFCPHISPESSAASQPTHAVRTVATGLLMSEQHFLAIRSDGSLWAWGNNAHGQLGDGTTTDRTSANPVKVMDNVRFVAAEQGFSMAITNDGVLWAWGSNTHGRLGDGTVINRYTPVKVMDNAAFVALGRNYAFAVKDDGGLYAWGQNIMGSLGDGSPIFDAPNRHSPVKIMDDVINIGVGINRPSWAVKSDNSLWAWSGFGGSVIEDYSGVNVISSVPVKIAENVSAIDIPALGGWFMLLRPSGDLHGYGDNNSGQLGDGTGINRDSLVWIMNNVTSAVADSNSAFVVRGDNSLWGWGDNYRLGSFISSLPSSGITYSPIKLMEDVSTVLSPFNTYVLKTDGTFWEYSSFGGATLLMSDVAVPQPEAPNLGSASQWARDGISSAIAKGFVPSDLQSNYTNVITRAEFCRMAVKWLEYRLGKGIDAIVAENGDQAKMGHTFSDTDDPAILAAYRLGITGGTSAPTAGNPGTFTPSGQFSREQAATMIRNTCRAAGMDVSNVASAGFEDIGSASSWAVDGINFVRNADIMSGTSTTPLLFSPQSNYTREQSIITFDNI